MAKTTLDSLLKQIEDLIRRLTRKDPESEHEIKSAGPMLMFVRPEGGGLFFSRAETRRFDACAAQIVKFEKERNTSASLSIREAENWLRDAVFSAIGPVQVAPSAPINERLSSAIERLRTQLESTPDAYVGRAQVQRLLLPSANWTFGLVTFHSPDAVVDREWAKKLQSFDPEPGRFSEVEVEQENDHRKRTSQALLDGFAGHPTATTTVSALGPEAAKVLVLEQIRRTVDVVNFFGGMLPPGGPFLRRALVSPDSAYQLLPWMISSSDVQSYEPSATTLDKPVVLAPMDAPEAQKLGMGRASELMTVPLPSPLAQRTINAMSWAGRASAEARKDQSFLLFAIALEALFSKPGARGGTTDRLALRCAHVLGQSQADKVQIAKLVKLLYRMRSDLVHNGDSTQIAPQNLNLLRALVSKAIVTVLTQEPFVSHNSESEFETWIDHKQLQ